MEEIAEYEAGIACSEGTSGQTEHAQIKDIKQELPDDQSSSAAVIEHSQKAIESVKTEETFQCHVCFGDFSNESEFRIHSLEHEKCFPCYNCGENLTSEQFVSHKCSTQPSGRNPNAKKEIFNCDECGKMFLCKSSVKRHKVIHSAEKNSLECDECGKGFAQMYSLTNHMRTHLPQEMRPFECAICQRRFTNSSHLKNHMGAVHEKFRPYHCEKCDRCFFRKIQVKQHNCQGTNADDSDKLERTVTFKGPTDEIDQIKMPLHQCAQCNKVFTTKEALVRHGETHIKKDQGLKPFHCVECGNCYVQRSSLRVHMKRAHSGRPKFVRPSKLFDEKPYQCKVCQSTFTSQGNVNYHMKTVHQFYRPFSCQLCKKGFHRRDGLAKHKCLGNKDDLDTVFVAAEQTNDL